MNNEKIFLASFRDLLDLRGPIFLMTHENVNTFIPHNSNNEGAWNLSDNYSHLLDIKKKYKRNIDYKNFSEALKYDARTQLAIIDDIEQKFRNAGYEPSPEVSNASSEGGRTKRRSNKRKKTKRRSNKRKKTKRRSNKRKY